MLIKIRYLHIARLSFLLFLTESDSTKIFVKHSKLNYQTVVKEKNELTSVEKMEIMRRSYIKNSQCTRCEPTLYMIRKLQTERDVIIAMFKENCDQ